MQKKTSPSKRTAQKVSEKLGPPYLGGSSEYVLYHLYMAQYYLDQCGTLPLVNRQPLVQRWIGQCISDAKQLHKHIGDTEEMFNRYGGLKP